VTDTTSEANKATDRVTQSGRNTVSTKPPINMMGTKTKMVLMVPEVSARRISSSPNLVSNPLVHSGYYNKAR
jgi:hypothetical protein